MTPTTDRSRWAALYVLCAGTLMIVLDATIVNVALPSIQDDLDFSPSNLAWVVNAYLIAFGGLLLLAGRAGDLLGQRRVFVTGLAIFTAASVLCAVSVSQEMLVISRFVQGAGGALTSAVVLGMIVTMFPQPREQAKALGVYGFVASAGGSIGLLAGGVLTDAISWHWIFLINLPIGVLTAVLALRLVPSRPGLGLSEGTDLLGALLLTVGVMLGVYAILDHSWALGAVGVALVAAFVIRQARVANPLMPLRLFRSRDVVGTNLIMALLVVGMFGSFFLGALYLQRILGYSPLQVGLAFLPGTVMMAFCSLRLSHRFAPRTILAPALAITTAGLALYIRMPADGTYVIDVLPSQILTGLGHGPVDARDDDAGDVRRDAAGRRPGQRPDQHHRAGRRRDRPGRPGHDRGRDHRRLAGPAGAAGRLPRRVRGRRGRDVPGHGARVRAHVIGRGTPRP